MDNAQEDAFKEFRYREQMERLSIPCPPEDFAPRETVAFRWVFEEMGDEQNFVPQYFKNPDRFNEKEDKLKCQALGLSLFDSAVHAIKQFAVLRKYLREDVLNLGTHLAKGAVQLGFGLSDLPNHKGHFTLYPFANIELKEHFEIVSTL